MILTNTRLLASAIKLAVEDLLPGAEVELALCDGNDNLPPHDLPLQMPIGIILTGIMPVLRHRLMRRKLLQPHLKIMMQPRLIVIDKNRRRDMHGIDEHQPFTNAAFPQALFHLRGNIDKCPSRRRLKPEFLPVAFHLTPLPH